MVTAGNARAPRRGVGIVPFLTCDGERVVRLCRTS